MKHTPLAQETRTRSSRHWIGSLVLAVCVHLALWWLPVRLNATQPPRRTIKLRLVKPQPARPRPRPRVTRRRPAPPKRRVRKKRKRRKRRVRKRRKRRVRKKRKRPVPRRKVRRPVPRRVVPPPPAPAPRAAPRPTPAPPPPRPAPLQQTAPAPPVKRVQKPVDLGPYRSSLNEAIQRHKRYPRMAHRMGFEGTVVLVIRLSRRGALIGKPKIIRSSGHRLLDREAVRMVVAASPLPAMPRAYRHPIATFRIPVNFSLQ